MSELGENVRRARRARKLARRALAELAQVSERTIQRLENGEPINRLNLRAILSALGISASEGEISDSSIDELDQNVLEVPASETIRIPLFDRDVSAGFVVVPDDLSETPDGWLQIPAFRSIDPRDIWALRIRGDSMLPRYRSGSRVILARVRYYEKSEGGLDCAQIEIGEDFYVCLADGRQTFKQVVGVDLEAITLRARNEKRYPESFRIPWQDVVNLSKRIGVLDPD